LDVGIFLGYNQLPAYDFLISTIRKRASRTDYMRGHVGNVEVVILVSGYVSPDDN